MQAGVAPSRHADPPQALWLSLPSWPPPLPMPAGHVSQSALLLHDALAEESGLLLAEDMRNGRAPEMAERMDSSELTDAVEGASTAALSTNHETSEHSVEDAPALSATEGQPGPECDPPSTIVYIGTPDESQTDNAAAALEVGAVTVQALANASNAMPTTAAPPASALSSTSPSGGGGGGGSSSSDSDSDRDRDSDSDSDSDSEASEARAQALPQVVDASSPQQLAVATPLTLTSLSAAREAPPSAASNDVVLVSPLSANAAAATAAAPAPVPSTPEPQCQPEDRSSGASVTLLEENAASPFTLHATSMVSAGEAESGTAAMEPDGLATTLLHAEVSAIRHVQESMESRLETLHRLLEERSLELPVKQSVEDEPRASTEGPSSLGAAVELAEELAPTAAKGKGDSGAEYSPLLDEEASLEQRLAAGRSAGEDALELMVSRFERRLDEQLEAVASRHHRNLAEMEEAQASQLAQQGRALVTEVEQRLQEQLLWHEARLASMRDRPEEGARGRGEAPEARTQHHECDGHDGRDENVVHDAHGMHDMRDEHALLMREASEEASEGRRAEGGAGTAEVAARETLSMEVAASLPPSTARPAEASHTTTGGICATSTAVLEDAWQDAVTAHGSDRGGSLAESEEAMRAAAVDYTPHILPITYDSNDPPSSPAVSTTVVTTSEATTSGPVLLDSGSNPAPPTPSPSRISLMALPQRKRAAPLPLPHARPASLTTTPTGASCPLTSNDPAQVSEASQLAELRALRSSLRVLEQTKRDLQQRIRSGITEPRPDHPAAFADALRGSYEAQAAEPGVPTPRSEPNLRAPSPSPRSPPQVRAAALARVRNVGDAVNPTGPTGTPLRGLDAQLRDTRSSTSARTSGASGQTPGRFTANIVSAAELGRSPIETDQRSPSRSESLPTRKLPANPPPPVLPAI
jgi:hypothetical protein